MSRVISRDRIFLFFKISGTLPSLILLAKPSIIAVLPTPGSPTNTGLFLVRRDKILITRSISRSRPMTGSIFLLVFLSVKFVVNSSRPEIFCLAFFGVRNGSGGVMGLSDSVISSICDIKSDISSILGKRLVLAKIFSISPITVFLGTLNFLTIVSIS